MPYNFDHVPNRRRAGVLNKWTSYPKDVLPLWVADMDFPAPKPILEALRQVVDHGVLGYESPSVRLQETVAGRMDRLYGWKVKPEAVVPVTGIVSGFNMAARAFSAPKRGYLIQPPVYNEFHEVKSHIPIRQFDAPLVKSVQGNTLCYEIDWDDFKKQIRKSKMFLLCNPHNPVGIVFSHSDLSHMAEVCMENDVVILSDEIHSELLLDDREFIPMATLSPEVANRTVTFVAPSKTFNVPGLLCGFAIIPDKELRERYAKVVENLRIHVNSFGLHAAQAAFSGRCDGWLRALRRYLKSNRDFLVDYVTQNMPGVRITVPEATYLAWMDFSQLQLEKSPYDFFLEKARVALSDGTIFGEVGRGHARLNFGTSRKILKQGLERMRKALHSL